MVHFAGCELSASPVSSGHRAALVYGLSLRSLTTGSAVPFVAAPTRSSDVLRLRGLLSSWSTRRPRVDDPEMGRPPQRVLLLLENAREPRIETLEGGDKALVGVVRDALEGCEEAGGYLARIVAVEHLAPRARQDEDDEYADDYGPPMFPHDDYEVRSTDWVLNASVDVRSGVALRYLGDEALALGRELEDDDSIALIPERFCDDVTESALDRIDPDGEQWHNATSTHSRIVLVLASSRDPWRELAAAQGVNAAIAHLLAVLRAEDAAGDKRARLALAPGVSASHRALSLLSKDLQDRGCLTIASLLVDECAAQRVASSPAPLALLDVVMAFPRSEFPVPLLSRIFRDFAEALVGHAPDDDIIAALVAASWNPILVASLCDAIRSANTHIGSRVFCGSLRLARRILEGRLTPLPTLSIVAGAGQKRGRGGESAQVPQPATHVSCAEMVSAGLAVLSATAQSASNAIALHAGGLGELLSLMLQHGGAGDVQAVVLRHLQAIASDRALLAAIFLPRDTDIGLAISRSIKRGIPQLAAKSLGPLLLLTLASELCSLDIAQPSTRDSDSAAAPPDTSPSGPCAPAASLAAHCAAILRGLPSEPVEPHMLSLGAAPQSISPLELCVCSSSAPSPALMSAENVQRHIIEIVDAWPMPRTSTNSTAPCVVASDQTTRSLLSLILSSRWSDLADYVVEKWFAVLIRLDYIETRDILFGALCRAIIIDAPAGRAWHAVIRSVSAALRDTAATGQIVSCLAVLAERVRKERSPLALRMLSAVLYETVACWPRDVLGPPHIAASLSLLHTLATTRCAGAAVQLLPRLPYEALIGCVRESHGVRRDFVSRCIKRLGWSPFGESLGRAIAGVLRTPLPSQKLDLVASAEICMTFLDRVTSILDARDAVSDSSVTSSARRVMQPVVLAVLNVAVGRDLVSVSPLSPDGCAAVAKFLHSSTVNSALRDDVGHQAFPGRGGARVAWAEFAGSAAGRKTYPLASLVTFAERELLRGTRASPSFRTSLCLLLRALVSAEEARLAVPPPSLLWSRPRVCLDDCRMNSRGPASCRAVNEFLQDPSKSVATFRFADLRLLFHVRSLLSHASSFLAISRSEDALRVEKLPGTPTARAQLDASKQFAADYEVMIELRDLRRRFDSAAAAEPAPGRPEPASG